MIDYKEFQLDNGLKVLVHEDKSSPMAVVNILYNVGSKDEIADKTGFAHLFEHLMFGGSAHIPAYDTPLQKVGGENNAFTSPDITNYYITIPAQNIETAFWLESDRMLSLSFDEKVLEIQRKVVIEEFKQRYLNQPYGDVWLKMRPLSYKVHPYRWPTIGKEISHIENATMQDVKEFFYKYYIPNNAVMVVGGNIKFGQVKTLAEKWFGQIPAGNPYVRNLPKEPEQVEKRTLKTKSKVPLNAIYKAYHTVDRLSKEYHSTDLMSDMLGRGQSSLLYQQLVKERKIFNSIHSYILGSTDEGLLMIDGKINDDFSFEQAENAITEVIQKFQSEELDRELQKVKNQSESALVMSEIELLNRCMNLAFAANLGNPALVNQEAEKLQAVSAENIKKIAATVLRDENSTVLYYEKQ